MATYSRPGVFIQEVALPQSVVVPDNGTAVGAFVGTLSKGTAAAPVLVTGWTEFVKTFGGLNDAYPTTWAAYNFFANGGRNLYVQRVLGAGAAAGTVTITDGDDPANNAFTVTAISAGSWSSSYGVKVVSAGSASRFGLIVYGAPTIFGNALSNPVEQFTDLSMDPTDRNYVLSVINSSSSYIRISGVDSEIVPATGGSVTALSGGANGDAPERADYQDAWSLFDPVENPIVAYNPDAPYASTDELSSQLAGDTVVYASSRTDVFAVVDTPSGMSVTDAKTQAADIKAVYAASSMGGNVAAYYPWFYIPDTTKSSGTLRLQAPGAAAVGQYLATDASRGVFKTPAGYNNRIALAVASEHQFTNAELDDINTNINPLNAIRQVPGNGLVILGGRTMDNTPENRYINIRRSLIYIEKELSERSAFAIFENNDERLWLGLRTSLTNFLRQYWQAGGLRGATPAQAFYVKCDGSTTSFSDIQNGRVNIEVGVALQYPTEFVVIKLGQLTGNATA